jgi:hypothetical protein
MFFFPISNNSIQFMTKYFLKACLFLLVFVISCSKDNSAVIDCTSESPTYTNEIATILNASCATTGCHTSTFPADGIDLSSYEKAKSASINGKVLKSIMHESGASAMPQSLPKLSEDKIKKVHCWVQNGAPQ